jgi:hypothetical protein
MIDRLIELGFSAAEILGRQRDRVVVRARHPMRGWMYEKFAEDDHAALEAWVASVNRLDPTLNGSRADPERQPLDANPTTSGEQP